MAVYLDVFEVGLEVCLVHLKVCYLILLCLLDLLRRISNEYLMVSCNLFCESDCKLMCPVDMSLIYIDDGKHALVQASWHLSDRNSNIF